MKLLRLVITGILLAGCSSAPVTRFFVLSPVAVTNEFSRGQSVPPISLGIREVRLPQYLERPQIVVRSGDHQVYLAEDAQWAGNLQQDMTRVLTQNLAQFLHSDRIFSAPHNSPLKPEFRLELEVMRFEQNFDRRVVLSVRWWLVRTGDNTLLEAPSLTLYGTPLDVLSYESLVDSMSSVYGELAQAIARSVNTHAKVTR